MRGVFSRIGRSFLRCLRYDSTSIRLDFSEWASDSDGKRDPIEGGLNRLRQWHTFVTGYDKRIPRFLRLWSASFVYGVVHQS